MTLFPGFLFVLAMEGCDITNRDNGFHLSHVFYPEDVIFMGEWSRDNIINLIGILHYFYIVSGLQINLQKSNLFGVCVSQSVVDQFTYLTRCKVTRLSFLFI